MEYQCSICKETISTQVYDFSMNRFAIPLCMKHQELEKQKLFCQKCKQLISKTVYDYSIGHFSKPLCIDCQNYLHRMAVKGDNTFQDKGITAIDARRQYLFQGTNSQNPLTMSLSAKIARLEDSFHGSGWNETHKRSLYVQAPV
jgi:hypothetical protein